MTFHTFNYCFSEGGFFDLRQHTVGGISWNLAIQRLRLRYEIRREFAPYIGVSWKKAWGDTANIVRAAGAETSSLYFVAGLRLWF